MEQDMMYDIVIVGSGPAGATLARLAGKKHKILVIEKRTFDENMKQPLEKCCGGLIAPDAQRMLASFNLGVPSSVLVSPQLFAVRTIDMDNDIERYYQRHYINIDREAFDGWMESIIPKEVDRIKGACYHGHVHTNQGVVVTYSINGEFKEVKSRMLVGADGAVSRVRRVAFREDPSPSRYISIQEWFKTEKNTDYFGAIFDREISDFYSWTIPKDGYLILGAALKPEPGYYQKFELLKDKLEHYGFHFDCPVKRDGAQILRPASQSEICTGRGCVVLIGEAAGFISPSSAEGLSYGFRSAFALNKALEEGLEGAEKRYDLFSKGLKRNILGKNIKSPAMYNKTLRKWIMKTGISSVQVVG